MYDSIIIGCGPAGMTAALYLLRSNKKVLIIEKGTIGGAIASSPLVENYPGFSSISGAELTSKMFDQIDNLGCELELDEVTDIKKEGANFIISTSENSYKSKTVIIASGSKYRTLGLDNEDNLIGHGIHFCVACDGAFYKDKEIAIIGGGNSACINAYSMSSIAKKVYILQNVDKLTCESDLKDKLDSLNNIEIIYNASVTEYLGDDHIIGLKYNNNQQLDVAGIFLSIGLIPQNNFASKLLTLDRGYIKSDNTETDVDGLFVAGDSRTKKYKQVTIACSDGTVAAMNAIEYLNNN